MKDIDVITLLLSKELEISGKLHNAISEIMRLGYKSERGKTQVQNTIESIRYTLDDIERILNR